MSDTESNEPQQVADPVESDRDLRDAAAVVSQQVKGEDDPDRADDGPSSIAPGTVAPDQASPGLAVEGRDDHLHHDASLLSEEG